MITFSIYGNRGGIFGILGIFWVPIWWCTSNYGLNWQILPDTPMFKPQKRKFLDSNVLSDWYHFNWHLLDYKISKKIKSWCYRFSTMTSQTKTSAFCENIFPRILTVAANHHQTSTHPRKNIVPQACMKCVPYKLQLMTFDMKLSLVGFGQQFGCHGNRKKTVLNFRGTTWNNYSH